MIRLRPVLFRTVVFILIPIFIGFICVLKGISLTLPQTEGNITVSGISNPVNIYRDAHGVPHIKASTDKDAFFAMGYVHAQDRLWQLELQRRIAKGRLSEILGQSSIEQDIWFRTLGFDELAKNSWKTLSKEAQSSLLAYSAGINSYLNSLSVLPIEYIILGINPEPWSVYDSLAWIKIFALNLGGNYKQEIDHFYVGQILDKDYLLDIFPHYPTSSPYSTTTVSVKDQISLSNMTDFLDSLVLNYSVSRKNIGSNAWVISGKHTKNGETILANDPHLGLQIPSIWYTANIQGHLLNASGMSIVGIPLIIFGKNNNIAWGGVNMMADAQDLYFMHINPRDNTQYKINNEWKNFDIRIENISVKTDFPSSLSYKINPVRVKIRTSRHGPIISDIIGRLDNPVALRWTGLEKNDTTYEAFYRINYANNWKSFRRALKLHIAPALNFLYIDKLGNIGYQAAGKIPIRLKSENVLPKPGWTDDYTWSGYIPFQELPKSYNPSKGFIIMANNKITDTKYPHYISLDWASPDRAIRINQLLTNKIEQSVKLTVEDMKEIQADTVDLSAKKLLPILIRYIPRNKRQKRALKYLVNWDGNMNRDSNAAALFHVWIKHLRHEIFIDEFRNYWGKHASSDYVNKFILNLELNIIYSVLIAPNKNWCDNMETTFKETCDDMLSKSLNDAIWEIYKITGNWNMKNWKWKNIHKAYYQHIPFSKINILNKVFERKISNGGSSNSINAAYSTYDVSDGYLQRTGATFRQIIALNDDESSYFYMNSTGQSGNISSMYYDNMLKPFNDINYYSISKNANSNGSEVLLLTTE